MPDHPIRPVRPRRLLIPLAAALLAVSGAHPAVAGWQAPAQPAAPMSAGGPETTHADRTAVTPAADAATEGARSASGGMLTGVATALSVLVLILVGRPTRHAAAAWKED